MRPRRPSRRCIGGTPHIHSGSRPTNGNARVTQGWPSRPAIGSLPPAGSALVPPTSRRISAAMTRTRGAAGIWSACAREPEAGSFSPTHTPADANPAARRWSARADPRGHYHRPTVLAVLGARYLDLRWKPAAAPSSPAGCAAAAQTAEPLLRRRPIRRSRGGRGASQVRAV